MDERERKRISPLAEVETEVLAEGQEWMRQEMRKRLQRQADKQGAFSPSQWPPVAPRSEGSAASDDVRG